MTHDTTQLGNFDEAARYLETNEDEAGSDQLMRNIVKLKPNDEKGGGKGG